MIDFLIYDTKAPAIKIRELIENYYYTDIGFGFVNEILDGVPAVSSNIEKKIIRLVKYGKCPREAHFDYLKAILKDAGGFTDEELVQAGELLKNVLENYEDWDSMYSVYKIPKKSGGFRVIEAPNELLKKVQRALLEKWIYVSVSPSNQAHGFVKKRGTKTNAYTHFKNSGDPNALTLLKMDLRDFFPSISITSLFNEIIEQTAKRLVRDGIKESICVNKAFAETLSRLASGNVEYRKTNNSDRVLVNISCADVLGHYLAFWLDVLKLCSLNERLPQGSPCSPALSNIFMLRFDKNIKAILHRADLSCVTYTRYADDLTFSSDDRHDMQRIVPLVYKSIEAYPCIDVSFRKTGIFRRGHSQKVTGINITDKVSIPRKERDKIRAELHNIATGRKTASNADMMRLSGQRAWMRGVDDAGWDARCEKLWKEVTGK